MVGTPGCPGPAFGRPRREGAPSLTRIFTEPFRAVPRAVTGRFANGPVDRAGWRATTGPSGSVADEAGVPVDAVESEIQQQVDRVRAELRQARVEQDDYLVDLHEAELDGLVRTADAHGLRVDR